MVVRFVALKMVPFIQLYGLYVIMHGEDGPGGGFQGGVIFASSVILYGLVVGTDAARRSMSQTATELLSSLGILLFAGIGLLTLLLGGRYLEYRILPLGTPLEASALGILGIEIGVGMTVAAVMVSLFYELAKRRP